MYPDNDKFCDAFCVLIILCEKVSDEILAIFFKGRACVVSFWEVSSFAINICLFVKCSDAFVTFYRTQARENSFILLAHFRRQHPPGRYSNYWPYSDITPTSSRGAVKAKETGSQLSAGLPQLQSAWKARNTGAGTDGSTL
jgi:hypothetical protein